jgi:tetratricopeptide (TPR) repeat protein
MARGQWDLERARRHFAKAHDARPTSAVALRELAATAQEVGDTSAAFAHWKALLLLPLDETGAVRRSDALVGLARLYEDEGERAKAAELYAHALAVAPDHEEAQRGAARTR